MKVTKSSDGSLAASWVRQTRIDGDNWAGMDVPVGETAESYQVRVLVGTEVQREEIVSLATWTYSSAQQASDGVNASFVLEIAQISDRFGPGLYGRIEINE